MLPAPPAAAPADTAPEPTLRLTGTDAEVAADLARLINGGWRFCAVPVLVRPGVWLVNPRRP